MGKLTLAAAAVMALAGCETPQELYAYYMQQHPMQVCAKAITSPRNDIRQAAGQALMQRQIDCVPYVPAIAAQTQANQAQVQQGLMLMQAGRAKPAQTQSPVHCRTVWAGNGYNTVCD